MKHGDYYTKEERQQMLLAAFKRLKKCTTNEAINHIYRKDLKKGVEFMLNRGWKFYNHMNKQTVNLAKQKNIKHVGQKIGIKNRYEKVWEFKKELQ